MAVKTRKPVVEEIEEEEEEEAPAPRKRSSTAVKERPSERAMRETKAATKPKAVVATSPRTARFYVTQVLLVGAPREEVKKRAMAQAKKDGADVSFKTFDVAYFIKFLEGKDYRVSEKNGVVKVIAPKA